MVQSSGVSLGIFRTELSAFGSSQWRRRRKAVELVYNTPLFAADVTGLSAQSLSVQRSERFD